MCIRDSRKAYPKGSYIEGFTISPRLNYYRFNVNPNKRNNDFVVTQYKKGIVRVLLSEDFEYKTLLKYGVRNYESNVNPSYPVMAWDPKVTRIAVTYVEAVSYTHLDVYKRQECFPGHSLPGSH